MFVRSLSGPVVQFTCGSGVGQVLRSGVGKVSGAGQVLVMSGVVGFGSGESQGFTFPLPGPDSHRNHMTHTSDTPDQHLAHISI